MLIRTKFVVYVYIIVMILKVPQKLSLTYYGINKHITWKC